MDSRAANGRGLLCSSPSYPQRFRSLSSTTKATLVVLLVLTRLDYDNAMLAGIPANLLCCLQAVSSAAARSAMLDKHHLVTRWAALASCNRAHLMQADDVNVSLSVRHNTPLPVLSTYSCHRHYFSSEPWFSHFGPSSCLHNSTLHRRRTGVFGCSWLSMEGTFDDVTTSLSLTAVRRHLWIVFVSFVKSGSCIFYVAKRSALAVITLALTTQTCQCNTMTTLDHWTNSKSHRLVAATQYDN